MPYYGCLHQNHWFPINICHKLPWIGWFWGVPHSMPPPSPGPRPTSYPPPRPPPKPAWALAHLGREPPRGGHRLSAGHLGHLTKPLLMKLFNAQIKDRHRTWWTCIGLLMNDRDASDTWLFLQKQRKWQISDIMINKNWHVARGIVSLALANIMSYCKPCVENSKKTGCLRLLILDHLYLHYVHIFYWLNIHWALHMDLKLHYLSRVGRGWEHLLGLGDGVGAHLPFTFNAVRNKLEVQTIQIWRYRLSPWAFSRCCQQVF